MIAAAERGYRACERLARRHYENFSVGSLLLPRGTRRHVYALYAFARTTDDLGDEAEGDRLALLDRWEEDLRRCYGGKPHSPTLVALRETIRACDIPPEPFLRLIEANRMDQHATRHPTFADLVRYCEHSANPCGRLILYAFGHSDPGLFRLSDYTCTALQLTNFWQDLAVDYAKGRIYIPLEDMKRFGYSEKDLADGVVNDSFRRLMAFECARTRELFVKGLALVGRLKGAAKFDIRLFSLGGMRVLDLIEMTGYDVFRHRPTLSKLGKAWLAVSSLLGVTR